MSLPSPARSLSTSSYGLRSPAGSISSSVASRSGSMDLVESHQQRKDQILPTQCYICESKFGGDCHSVLQLCDCRVAPCQQCAVNRMVLNEGLHLDCLICGSKVESGSNVGVIKNVTKVKDQEERLLERGFRFFKLPVPTNIQGTTASVSQYYPLLARYGRISELATHLSEFLRSSFSSSVSMDDEDAPDAIEAAQKERRKLNVHYLKLQLSRVEYLRAGPLSDVSSPSHPPLSSPSGGIRRLRSTSTDLGDVETPGNLTFPIEETALPLGPLSYLSLTRNVFLERLLSSPSSSGGSGGGGKDCREINANCYSCQFPVAPGESIVFTCNCEMVSCRNCALRSFSLNKNTYRKGIACPCCHKNSLVSFANLEKAKEEEGSLIEMLIRAVPSSSKEGHKYSSKSIGDLRKLLEHLYVSGMVSFPAGESKETIHSSIHEMSFHQLELTLARLYVVIERKKSRHERIIKKERKAATRKALKEATATKGDAEDEATKKAAASKKAKKTEDVLAALDFDRLLYADKEEEKYFHEADNEIDRGFELPLGPLRLLQFNPNSYIELYLANTATTSGEDDFEDPHEREIADLVKMHRFNPFKPKFNTRCPKCRINPQNLDYVRIHLKTCHEINRKDETEKFMKLVALDPVPFDYSGYDKHVKMPFPSNVTGGMASHPPQPPHINDLSFGRINFATMQN